MGQDTFALLPPNVRVGDVASVLGKLLGKGHRAGPHLGTDVLGVEVGPTGVVEMARIIVRAGDTAVDAFYHFESSRRPGWRKVGFGHARPRRIALGRRLVDFFGGVAVANDHAEDDPATVTRSRRSPTPRTPPKRAARGRTSSGGSPPSPR